MSRRLKDIGDWGEEQACAFLRRQGFQIIDRNFFTTVGEIDVIAKKGDDFYLRRRREKNISGCFSEPRSKYCDIYFIEVKTREAGDLANDSAITHAKKFKFEKTARRYCYEKGIDDNFGLIFAGLIVSYEKVAKMVNFRLAVWRD